MAGVDLGQVRPEFRTRLLQFVASSGGKVTIGNAFRTRAQQAYLFKTKPHLAAPPGRSNHERGLAADLVYTDGGKWAHANAGRFGLKFPMLNPKGKKFEPWHVELAEAAPTAYAQEGADQHDHDHAAPAAAPAGSLPPPPKTEDRHDPEVQLLTLAKLLVNPINWDDKAQGVA